MNNPNGNLGPDAISKGNEWILREAAGSPKLIRLIGAREAEIDRVIHMGEKSVVEQTHLADLQAQILAEKQAMGLDVTVHPKIDYTVTGTGEGAIIQEIPSRSADK